MIRLVSPADSSARHGHRSQGGARRRGQPPVTVENAASGEQARRNAGMTRESDHSMPVLTYPWVESNHSRRQRQSRRTEVVSPRSVEIGLDLVGPDLEREGCGGGLSHPRPRRGCVCLALMVVKNRLQGLDHDQKGQPNVPGRSPWPRTGRSAWWPHLVAKSGHEGPDRSHFGPSKRLVARGGDHLVPTERNPRPPGAIEPPAALEKAPVNPEPTVAAHLHCVVRRTDRWCDPRERHESPLNAG